MFKFFCKLGCLSIALLSISPVHGKDTHVMETQAEEANRHAGVTTDLFRKSQWGKLEKLMGDARKEQARNSFGGSLLGDYYAGCRVAILHDRKEPDAKWLGYLKKLDEWEKAKPGSLSVVALRIKFWTSFAWKARGDGFGANVDENGWKHFGERLGKAQDIYNLMVKKYGEKPVPCPEFYSASMSIALGKGWKNQRTYDELVMPVIKHWPRYYGAYTAYAHKLQPQWSGRAGANYEFFLSLKKVLGGELGMEVSAYCILDNEGKSLNQFRYDLVDEDEMLEGLVYHVKQNPNDADLIKRVIEFSSRYGGGVSQKLLKSLKDVAPETFQQFEDNFGYGSAIKKMMDSPKRSIELDYYIRPESTDYIRAIRSVATRDGVGHTVYAQGWEALVVVRNSDCKILAIEKVRRDDLLCYEKVALSKSGDHIFVEVRHKGRRVFRIYTFINNQLKLIKSVPGPLGITERAEFVEDDKTILLVGEERGSNYKKSLYYRWDWKTDKPEFIAKSTRARYVRMEVMRDKKQVVCYSGRDIFYYNYLEEKPKIHQINLNIGEKSPTVYDVHYAKEINALAVITQKDNYLAILDADTFEVKASKKLMAKPAFAILVDGYKYGKYDYTFCVSGEVGYLSIFQYDSKAKQPLQYESTWVNAPYHASHLNVVEQPGEPPRIMQGYYRGGIIGSYRVKEIEE